MNSGAPVLVAGEMEIKEGKLKSINTFSGHYEPSLYSIVLFLRYLSSKHVDISKTDVFILRNPEAGLGLNAQRTILAGDPEPWYKISAKSLVSTVDTIMEKNIASIDKYIKKTEGSLFYQVFKPEYSQKKVQLCKNFQQEFNAVLGDRTNSKNIETNKLSADKLGEEIDKYLESHKKIDSNSDSKLNKKFMKMRDQLKQISSGYEDESYEDKRDEHFKKLS